MLQSPQNAAVQIAPRSDNAWWTDQGDLSLVPVPKTTAVVRYLELCPCCHPLRQSPRPLETGPLGAWKRRPEAFKEDLATRPGSLRRWGASGGYGLGDGVTYAFSSGTLRCLTLGTVFVTAVIGVPIRESLMAKQKDGWGEPSARPSASIRHR